MLAKWPRAGRAKRRLGQHVGVAVAGSLARAFLADTLTLAANVGADRLVIAHAPPSAAGRLASLAPAALLVAQPRAAFGARLAHALGTGLELARRVVVIGTDSPTLSPLTVRAAFAHLNGADCVLGPSEDGGYYLIGCRSPLPRSLFVAMPWSTGAVYELTARRAREAGLHVARLATWYDVDDAHGLRRLTADLGGLRRAPATRRALAATRRT